MLACALYFGLCLRLKWHGLFVAYFLTRITRQAINEPQRLKKSRMIAKAFAKKMDKKMEDNDDAMSVSFESASHDDAIGK